MDTARYVIEMRVSMTARAVTLQQHSEERVVRVDHRAWS
jgi:hypothetical protein